MTPSATCRRRSTRPRWPRVRLAAVATAPGGAVVAVHTREGRSDVIALVRPDDRALVRWVRGARAAAWSPDGTMLALGGPWGVMLARAAGPRGLTSRPGDGAGRPHPRPRRAPRGRASRSNWVSRRIVVRVRSTTSSRRRTSSRSIADGSPT